MKNPLSNLLGAFCAVLLVAFALALTPSKAPASPAPDLSTVTLTAVDHVPAAPLAVAVAALPAINLTESERNLIALIAASALAIMLVHHRFSRRFGRQNLVTAINTNPANLGTKTGGRKTYLADAAITTRYKLVKIGSDASHTAVIAAASDQPKGVCLDEPSAAEDAVTIEELGGSNDRTVPVVAGGTITDGAALYSKGDGTVIVKPTAAGTYWKVGTAQGAWSSGEVLTMIPCFPRKLIVLAALTNTAGDIADTNSTAVNPTKSDFDSLLVAAGKLQADFLLLAAALKSDADIDYATT